MRSIFLFLIIVLTVGLVKAQDTLVIKRDLKIHLDALYSEDYTTYMGYMHPKIVTMIGGKEKTLEMMKGVIDLAKKQGMTSAESSFGAVSKIYPAAGHLYCTIPHTVKMNYPTGYLTITNTILGISEDKGKSWKYVAAGKVPRAALKKAFPDLPDSIEIIPGTKPVNHPNPEN